ncbi:MAG: hypothetical protein DRP61_02455 [Candidatus Omnitrophota bacterium]|nr:MAG: hypothetical protein DRP61_02455 [Candidatus Omnitrophota bacterium]RKY35698.1 MAG: hypothetical protein DRP69_00345 [Candidatus Omnitrophota bacterium]RKY43438.1 MAG: hypothetical protein DRP80_05205 [Candidatus Omnitrophota bacterium]
MHYNIITSCFLLIGTSQGMEKLSKSKILKTLNFRNGILEVLLSLFAFSLIILHSYLWVGILKCR